MNIEKLEKNLRDLILEEQVKLGYRKELLRLYYPLSSLNHLLEVDCTEEEMLEKMKEFSEATRAHFGGITASSQKERFCIQIPPEGVEYVHEHQEECMWAEVFHSECRQCGVDYCREIDGAIVRGFNPTLQFECTQNMHLTRSCDFYYHGKEIAADFMSTYSSRLAPGASTKREMAYHCADMYDMYCYVIRSVLPDRAQDIISAVRGRLAEKYGLGFLPALDAYQSTDFNQI